MAKSIDPDPDVKVGVRAGEGEGKGYIPEGLPCEQRPLYAHMHTHRTKVSNRSHRHDKPIQWKEISVGALRYSRKKVLGREGERETPKPSQVVFKHLKLTLLNVSTGCVFGGRTTRTPYRGLDWINNIKTVKKTGVSSS